MNHKTYSIFLCALLASTFVHELWAKGVAPANSPALGAAEPVVLERVKRDTPSLNLHLSLQVVANDLVIFNSTANAALVIDVSASVFLLLNGTSGSGVCIDRSNDNGTYISEGLWHADNQTLEDFLESLEDGISDLLDLDDAEEFNLESVKLSILQEITWIVVCLVVNIDGELERDVTLALETILTIVDGVLDLLKGVLEGLLALVGDLVIVLYVDISGLLNVLLGLASVIEKVGGNLAWCIENGVKFELELILGAANGLVCFINLIRQLGEALNLCCLVEMLGSVDSLFLLISRLGGEVSIGINGIFRVVGTIVAYIKEKGTLDGLLCYLLQHVSFSSVYVDHDLTNELNCTLCDLLNVLKEIGATEVLSDLVGIVNDLIGGTLVVGGCNFSKIISRLFVGPLGPADSLLPLVIEIVLLLDPVVGYALSIPYLLLVLICHLNCVVGVNGLKVFGIDVGAGDLINVILCGVKNLVHLLRGNLYTVLKKLPIIGNIVRAMDCALEKASDGALSLRKLLDASSLVKNLIIGVFQIVTGLPLGISSAIIVQAGAILKAVSSITALTSFDITAVVSVSSSG